MTNPTWKGSKELGEEKVDEGVLSFVFKKIRKVAPKLQENKRSRVICFKMGEKQHICVQVEVTFAVYSSPSLL